MDYIFEKINLTKNQIKKYSDLLSVVFPKETKFSTNYLNWLYNDNPVGEAVGYDCYYNHELIAHYVTIPIEYYINDSLKKGLLSLNTAVHPNHQGKGLFTKLALKTFQDAEKLGYEFVIGIANQNSTPGFIRKLGFDLVSALDVKIGFGGLVIDTSKKYTLKPSRSSLFIDWRISNPSKTYALNNNQLVFSLKKIGLCAQMSTLNESKNISKKTLSTCCLFTLVIGKGSFLQKKGLYFNLPDIFKPSPLNLIFKDLTGNIPKIEKDQVFFELIDFDAY